MKFIQPVVVSEAHAAWAALVIATLLSVPWPSALAGPVTPKQAEAVVNGWLKSDPTPLGETLGTSVQRVETFTSPDGSAVYYAAYLRPSGFVIVAADDWVEPIVGFARVGRFDPSEDNPLGDLVSKDVLARVAHARRAGVVSSEKSALEARAKWRRLGGLNGGPEPGGSEPDESPNVSDVRIAPLTQSTWDQQTAGAAGVAACYNYFTPPYEAGNVSNYPAGCVATAMSQLMRYYQFPTARVGTKSFTIFADGNPNTYSLRGGDSAGGPYVWTNMPLIPSANPPNAQCQAIGALVADAGATLGMSYFASGSSSGVDRAGTALVSDFDYSSAVIGFNDNSDIGAGLLGMINPNLDAHYPVLLGIEGSIGGHAVVADGYGYSASTLYHHLNLGWSGTASAWYALPLVDTSIYTFTIVDTCVYNAYTNGSGEIVSGRVLDQIGRPVFNAMVTATPNDGGVYTTTTDNNGIYALARIPSGSSYSVEVTKTNYGSVNGNFLTGFSTDYSATSGNYWGMNFTMPMLTKALDHLVWGSIASTQSLDMPLAATLTAENLTNGVASGFTGPVTLSGYASGTKAAGTIIGDLTCTGYMYGGSELTVGYAFTPNTNVQAIAVRGYSTDRVSIWTDGGTFLTSQSLAAFGSWAEAPLAVPIALSAGTTYRVCAHVPVGTNICLVSRICG